MEKEKRLRSEKKQKNGLFEMVDARNLIVQPEEEEKTDIEVNLTCPICLCELGQDEYIYNIACKHLFHIDCLEQWYARRKTCPICKQHIEFVVTTETHYTFNRKEYEEKLHQGETILDMSAARATEGKSFLCWKQAYEERWSSPPEIRNNRFQPLNKNAIYCLVIPLLWCYRSNWRRYETRSRVRRNRREASVRVLAVF